MDKQSLKQEILERYNQRHLDAKLITPQYINHILDSRRIVEAEENFSYEGFSAANTDYFPSAMQYYSVVLNEKENIAGYKVLDVIAGQPPLRIFLILLMLLMAPLIINNTRIIQSLKRAAGRSIGCVSFISGFTGFSCMSVLTYLYQIKIGSLYGDIGIISAANLLGYSIGAVMAGKLRKMNSRAIIYIFLCIEVMLGIILMSANMPIIFTGKISFVLFIMLWGVLNGAIYPLLSKYASAFNKGKIQTFIGLYTFELLGASLGAALTGMFLLGTIGFMYTVLLILGAVGINMVQLYLLEPTDITCCGGLS